MILKTHVNYGENTWLYLDRIRKVQTFAFPDPAASSEDSYPTSPQLFSNIEELRQAVDKMWGPLRDRCFDDELWPEFSTLQKNDKEIVIARLEQEDDRMVLALLDDTTYLLGDDGQTIDKLRY